MNITINGNDHTIEQIETIEDMLTQLGLGEKLVIVEQNRQIIDRGAYDQTVVRNNDTFEIVHFVGGG
ncbi:MULTISPECIES: sulfur carrier protein ThiS [Exiguobacterium]|uniref:sulfur carrier protein ThiS n=1 Tax=Exiguobacterium TaxID=33986 RepID=UPI0006F9D46E|nr:MULTISPECIES: sulfur carrier protein ThiS [unclassified Exiguobacterium]KQS45031.1 thiamine biosynthesis protein ThiS [Exiguobacterium sp. Leaf196]MDT0171855.1 sulfur carrier protein ThiS [Exiguobacterium sp. BRG2]HAK99861.1 thiamine biosynthesis protein ThiS [Exiguobacterium sp.]HCV52892.1 thiamine biosynthesis protein ThiS [Exiguobacterium sp.]